MRKESGSAMVEKRMRKCIGSICLAAALCAVCMNPYAQETESEGAVAAKSEMAKVVAVTEDWMVPVTAEELKDGTYDIEVRSSSSMFQITECTLTVEDGEMSAAMTMGGTGYRYVCMAAPEEAAKAEEKDYIAPQEQEDGTHVFTVPVPALDEEVACAAFSDRKEKWYGRQLCFVAESLPADAFAKEKGNAADALDLADGTYLAEVSLEGGSGKASITSPAQITVKDGVVTARIEWSSPNYDYMVAAGKKLLPVNEDGNSVFEIPVRAFDRPEAVKADTTAMSKPYEIAYTLTFDSETIQKQ